ncbi:MAG: PilZ domain-containing protein [Anaerolineales bacterium]
MAERRKLKRRHLIYYLRVFERGTGRIVGHLVDLTTEGLMLLSEEPIETDRLFYFRMTLPTEIRSSAHVAFNARSIWCRPDDSPDFYATGFSFEEVTSEDIRVIENLIESYGLRE